MPRILIQRSDGVLQRQKVSKANMHLYGAVVTNARGRKAFVKKSSEVRALEAVRGSSGTLRRVRLTLKASYSRSGKRDDGEKRRGHKLKLEADLVVVVDESDVDALKQELLAYAEEQAQRFGIDSEDMQVNEVSNEPASDATTGVDYADVLFRDRRNDNASGAIRDHTQSIIEGFGVESDPGDDFDEGEDERDDMRDVLGRAVQRTDKRGRSYWVDPETGKRTLNPELVR